MKNRIGLVQEGFFILFLTVVAFAVRFYKLSLFPLNHDEVNWILSSPDNTTTLCGIAMACHAGYVLPFYLSLISITRSFFTDPVYILRIPSVCIGVITIPLSYILARSLYDKYVATLSSLFLTFLPWHIIHSRDGREPIVIPFITCVLLLLALRMIRTKKGIYFYAIMFLLGFAACYMFKAAIIFIPIFFFMGIVFWKDLLWIRKKTWLTGSLLFVIPLCPLIYLESKGSIRFFSKYLVEHTETFTHAFMHNLVHNTAHNIQMLFRVLFIGSNKMLLYGLSLKAPLLLSLSVLMFLLCGIAIGIYQRNKKSIALSIFLAGFLMCFLPVIANFQARYCTHIIVPVMILASAGMVALWKSAARHMRWGRVLIYVLIVLNCVLIVTSGAMHIFSFYKYGPIDYDECRVNSYGCKEAADYLLDRPDIAECDVVGDMRMTLNAYLKTKQFAGRIEGKRYYVLWAPESHPADYWGGTFRYQQEYFEKNFPDIVPIHTIYYPNGIPAIYIYYVE